MARQRKGLLNGVADAKERFDKACNEKASIRTSNSDGLPDFRETFDLQKKGKMRTIWFCKHLDPKVVMKQNGLKEGRTLPSFYYQLYQHSTSLAIDVARCILRWADETPRVFKAFSDRLNSTLKCFTEVLIDKNVQAANKITIKIFESMFTKISDNYSLTSHSAMHRIFVKVIQHLPQLDPDVKFFLTKQSSIPKTELKKKLTVEAIETKLTGDHSDKTMFQIASYTHYCLDQISSTIQQTEDYIASERYIDVFEVDNKHQRDLKNFTRWIGRRKFLNALEKGELEQAMQIELAATYKFILGYEYVRKTASAAEYIEFCKNPVATVLPETLTQNPHVLYVVNVLKQLKSKDIKNKFIKRLKNGNYSVRSLLFVRDLSLERLKQKLAYKYYLYTAQFGWTPYSNTTNFSKAANPVPFLLGRTSHYDFLVITYLLMNTGSNLEVFISMPARVGERSILKNYSKESGAGKDAPLAEQEVSIFGFKNRVGPHKSAKRILVDVPVQSPAYSYLSVLDAVRDADREFFFNLTADYGWISISKYFTKKFNITDDKGVQLLSLQSPKFRKTYLGHQALKRLKDINSVDELITALRLDMDHADFSITFGYLMQSGHSSLVIDATLIAIQMKITDDRLKFSGHVNSGDRDAAETRNERFLCDCSDPSNPPHDTNLAHCRKFHLCLGCTRSEVFREHLPAIFYHLFDIEERMLTQPEVYKIAFEDKHMQAKDVIARFELYAEGGEVAVAKAFQIATTAKVNNTALCPPMLNA